MKLSNLEALCCAVLFALLLILVMTAPAQEPSDPHAGQIDHCSNAKAAPAAHQCKCSKEPGEDGSGCAREDVKCKTYCRPKACYCYHPKCDS